MGGRLQDRVAIVTGAGCVGPGWGNGRATAVRFAEEGAKIFAVDRNPESVAETVRHVEAAGGKIVVHQCDVTDNASVKAMVDACVARFSRIDILVNNVGGTIWARPYAQYEAAQIEAEIRRSLYPTLWCCRAVLPAMLEGGGGVIVNVSSVATRGVNRVPYAAAKGGVNALTACLAWEYAEQGIRVNAIAPGGTEAPPRRIPATLPRPPSRASRSSSGGRRWWSRPRPRA
jgi:dihydroxycyclohexadiene carboxylate dehydrogenase